MLSLIGLGLRDGDIAKNGVEALQDADVAYAELYTNAIEYDLDALQEQTGTDITLLERAQVEDEDRVLTEAQDKEVAFLVSGDPLAATTHQDLLFRAQERDIAVDVIHAPSILTAVAETGISIYKLGRVTTLPEPYNGNVPDSPFNVVENNHDTGLHTLMLLDIGMTAVEALQHIADRLHTETDVIVCSELGTTNRVIKYGAIDDLQSVADDFGVPCSIIIPGDLSDNEAERLEQHRVTRG